jgi:hypothetical protein
MADVFYKHGRPQHPTLQEDRPRGGPARRVRHKRTLSTGGFILMVFLVVLVGIALFP